MRFACIPPGPAALLLATALGACAGNETPTSPSTSTPGISAAQANKDPVAYSPVLAAINERLQAAGAPVRIDKAEIFVSDTGGWNGTAATTIIASNRTHHLGSLFVEGDPRRGHGNAITYVVDQSQGSAFQNHPTPGLPAFLIGNAVTEPPIDASMDQWRDVPCGKGDIVKVPFPGGNIDVLDEFLISPPGTPFIVPDIADITHGGWLPAAWFTTVFGPQGNGILGVTFSIIFTDENGVPTDLDGNGATDVAFREIFYNQRFAWANNTPRNVDIISVVTHEAGHGFGLGHFGKVFVDNNGTIKFAPRAVMNAVFVSTQQDLLGTDNASFCSLWANN